VRLTVVDFGVGIPSNVRLFFHNPELAANVALSWAFHPGTTTKSNGVGTEGGVLRLPPATSSYTYCTLRVVLSSTMRVWACHSRTYRKSF
jgi:hypothetical protein